MIQIKFKDIDPDTGNISQEKVIATCETTEQAKWLIEALYKHSDEPNRDFFREVVTEKPADKKGDKKKAKHANINEQIKKHLAEHQQAAIKNPPVNETQVRRPNTKTQGPPRNNGYVPYDQFKFD